MRSPAFALSNRLPADEDLDGFGPYALGDLPVGTISATRPAVVAIDRSAAPQRGATADSHSVSELGVRETADLQVLC